MNEKNLWNLSTTNTGPYIGLYLGVISGCLRTSSRKEPKGICLCKQATNVEDSSRTIVSIHTRSVQSVEAGGGGGRRSVCAASGCSADAADGGAYHGVLGEE